MSESYWLFAFESPHAAFAAQQLLSGCNAAVTPTLRSISASCGISLRLPDETIEPAKQLLRASSISPALYKLYRIRREGKQTYVALVDG